MIAVLVALVSIAALTVFTWWVNGKKLLPFQVCPICAGSAGTWIWLLAGVLSGLFSFAAYMPVVIILMGGSVVGIAYQSDKYLKSEHSRLLWRSCFIIVGFGTVGSVAHLAFGFTVLGVLALLAIAGFFLELPLGKGDAERAERLEEKMKDCC